MKKILLITAALFAFPAVRASEAEADTAAVRSEQLREVTVTDNSARRRTSELRLGTESLELGRLARVPMLFGENDILKSITLLPGVHGESDGVGGFEVRGGNAAQNLVLLDGITLYNPSHVMGIFSTFNNDAIGRATLYKGTFPAFYGGASASVLETSLAAGDMERYHGSLTVGLLAAKIKAEGPIVRDRLSFAVAARRSYVDAFLQMVPQYRKTVLNFYDVSAKLRFIPRAGDRLDLSFFVAHDNMAIKNTMGMYWGNLGASLNWLAHAGDRWTFATSAALTRYAPDMTMSVMKTDQTLYEYIHDYSVNEHATVALSDSHSLEFGLRSQLLRVKSAETFLNGLRQRDIRSGWQNALWLDWTGSFGAHFSAQAGLRLSAFSALSQSRFHTFEAYDEPAPDIEPKTYFDPEPRVSLKYSPAAHHSLKIGFGTTTQNLHALRAGTSTFPFDRYALTSASVRPERSLQYGLGYSGATVSGAYDWSAEAYYKDIKNVYDYMDGKGMFSAMDLESVILGGRGRSWGLELMARKNAGRLTGWLAYTLSFTQSKIPGINGGRWYDASNDRRHDFSATASYSLTDRWALSAAWIYSSGQPLTAPDLKYELGGTTVYYYSERNGYRTPPSHHLDLSATYSHVGKRFTYEWSFGIYNAYCRYNPFVIYFEDDPSKPSGTRAVQQSLYGIVPSVSYTLKF